MTGIGHSYYTAPEMAGRLNRLEGAKFVTPTFTTKPLLRLLAKIAHAFAVGEYGMGGFNPFLTDIILGKSRLYSHYIGNGPATLGCTTELHKLTSSLYDDLVVVSVGLYTRYGLRPYTVVAGRRTEGAANK